MSVSDPTLVSIVTPSFNSHETLARTLQSVRSQACTDFQIEHLVVDGGSRSDTLNILRDFEAAHRNTPGYTLSWNSEPDRGISDAFNKGVAQAKGDLIAILNSDDWHEKGAIQCMLDAHRQRLEQKLPPAILHGDMIWHEPSGNRFISPRLWGGRYQVDRAFWFDSPVCHPTCFVPRQVYQQVGLFRLDFRIAMDYEWLLRAHLAGVPFQYVNQQAIAHFQGGGASGQNTRLALKEVHLAQKLNHAYRLRGTCAYLAKLMVNRIKSVSRIRLAPGSPSSPDA